MKGSLEETLNSAKSKFSEYSNAHKNKVNTLMFMFIYKFMYLERH